MLVTRAHELRPQYNVPPLPKPNHPYHHQLPLLNGYMPFPLYHTFSLVFSSLPLPRCSSEIPISPDLLAIVGNITLGLNIVLHRRSSLIASAPCYPVNSLTNNPATIVHTVKVPDALASLLVSNKKVICIGL